ncbi:fimbrial protein [Klebsiella aerogenes]|uniref:fimbrial protein n=1 Tax=Klebsiella aerogenes TaxID=548 RepID=UPI0025501789|nr:fimbrial protein [Klebsiella aerogenes]MDK7100076.1 fimbrial protein [Klebsiella aerogenes]MDK7645553.1 fimbrial protein [Klebsiella aerogenes]MDK7850448.1 fimbrial protein [Klebsiella aerogenes]MDK8313043.1 fimbrial protein [Klebsiella aerogenes]
MTMAAFLSLGMVFWLLPSAYAQDNWDVEGSNGILHVYGALTESACRLEMTSFRQDVALGETGTGQLKTVGSQGTPVKFELRLTDCLHSSSRNRDLRTGGQTWASDQVAVSISFLATRDEDNPALIKAAGVSGLGLRLTTDEGKDVRIGSRGAPLLLNPGQDTLTYIVTPERTSANLVAGSYMAMVNFHLSYD